METGKEGKCLRQDGRTDEAWKIADIFNGKPARQWSNNMQTDRRTSEVGKWRKPRKARLEEDESISFRPLLLFSGQTTIPWGNGKMRKIDQYSEGLGKPGEGKLCGRSSNQTVRNSDQGTGEFYSIDS